MAMVMRDGLSAREEGFCDRAYRPDGGLVSRSEPGAVLTDPEEAARPGAQPGPRRGGRGGRLHPDAVGRHPLYPRRLARRRRDGHGGAPGAGRGAHRRGCSRVPVNRSVPVGAVRPLGDRAFLIGVADPEDGRALATGLAETTGWPGGSLDVVCGFATVMVVVRDPDVDAAAVEEIARRQAARRPPAARGVPHGAARSSCLARSTVPISTRWPPSPAATETMWLPCSVRPGSPSRSWGSRPGSPTSTGCPTSWRPSRGATGPARSCRQARWPWPTDTRPSTRRPRPADGTWWVARPFPSSVPTAPPYAALALGDVVRLTMAGPGQPVEPEPAAALAWPAADGARSGARDRDARAARRARGRRAPRRGRHRRPPWRAGRPGLLPAGQPAGGQRRRSGRVGDHRRRHPGALPLCVSRRRGRRRARCPGRRRGGARRSGGAAGPGPAARDRTPARRAAQLSGAWPAACADPSCSPAWPATS